MLNLPYGSLSKFQCTLACSMSTIREIIVVHEVDLLHCADDNHAAEDDGK